MSSESPKKRSSPSADNEPPAKRQRTASLTPALPAEAPVASPVAASLKTAPVATGGAFAVDAPQNEYHVNRASLQRSIALALEHVGFETASEEALESFTIMTETYLDHLSKDVLSLANHARRNDIVATDFDLSLKYFNIDLSDLKRHRRNAIPRDKIKGPERANDVGQRTVGDKVFTDLPCLDEELSGKSDKDARSYIPKYFPDFPSTHTYKYTPTDIESVTVRTPIHEAVSSTKAITQPTPDWRGDPKKIREAAAVQAKQAEEALRKLVRASKMASLKDLRSTAEQNPISKNRYDLWEEAMKDMLQYRGLADGRDDANREDVADLSMVVNAEKKYHRREIPRSAKKSMTDSGNG